MTSEPDDGDVDADRSQRGIFDLTGMVALVTGGNNGIGLASATALATAGASVAIWGRRSDRNREAVEALRRAGRGEMYSATVDVSDADAVATGFDDVVATLGRVDCTFVNAGIADHATSFLAISDESRDDVLGTNLIGAWSTIRAAVSHTEERAERGDPGGSIIVNGSLAASRGLAGGEHYGAAKAALGAVVRGIAVEYGNIGLRANMVCPGYIERDGAPGRFAAEIAKRGPIPRYGKPHEISGIVVYLASDASSYHTGDVITVDGGWSVNVR
jgi:NAD(P)-dependent dehydrogenase (short-subunit alcohol dehydrogenase family)